MRTALGLFLLAFSLAFAEGGGTQNILFWKIINTVILVIALIIIYKKWVAPALEKRRDNVEQMIKEARQAKLQSAEELKEAERKLEEAKLKFEETLKIAKQTAEMERENAKKEALEIAERIKQQTQEAIEVETKKAQNELRKYAVQKAIEISEKLVKEKANPELEKEMIQKTLKAIS